MSPNAERGFTLIEIMVALAVFAVISLIAYRGLDSVLTAKVHVDQEMRFWRDVGLVFDRIETDISQITTVSRMDSSGKIRTSFRAGNLSNQLLFELSRFDGARDPVHIGYRLREKTLELLLWRQDEKGEELNNPDVYTLLENVESCTVSFLNSSNRWAETWKGGSSEPRPQGVRIELQITDRGTFERMFALL